jgi:protoporphyrinogen oxidase
MNETIILGAGMSGLGAAISSGLTVYEANGQPGGTCFSYYVDTFGNRVENSTNISECFRFEPAGGHWLFGVSEKILSYLKQFSGFKAYRRRAEIYFPKERKFIPFPVQENLRYFDEPLKKKILEEILSSNAYSEVHSFKEWLLKSFGPSLCELFFFPFNERYTAGYYEQIVQQDLYKSVINKDKVLKGASSIGTDEGYNTIFYYPENGLDKFIHKLSTKAHIHYNHKVIRIDTEKRIVHFSNGNKVTFKKIISTIPLQRMLELSNLKCSCPTDPVTAVLVINIGAYKGNNCPSVHWVYIPHANSGIHRVGFYSNVDRSFLPHKYRANENIISLYVEKSYRLDKIPNKSETDQTVCDVIDELKAWKFIEKELVVDSVFTEIAYTWSWLNSDWRTEGIKMLEDKGIQQVGRYGAWKFQGMINSFEEGFTVGMNFH